MDEYIEVSPSLEHAIEMEKTRAERARRNIRGIVFDTMPLSDGSVTITRFHGDQTDVSLPGNIGGALVREISPYAFAGTSVRRVAIPEGVEKIGNGAFAECGSLLEISLPESLTELGAYAFADCGCLRTLRIPDGVKQIPMCLCRGCNTLKEARLPQGQQYVQIGVMAFAECYALKEIGIPEGVTLVREMAFFNSGVQRVSLPGTLRALDDNAFAMCANLEEIEVPEGVKEFGEHVFFSCGSLKRVHLPATLEKVVDNPFGDCGNLAEITVAAGNGYLKMMGNALMVPKERRLLSYAGGCGESFCIVPAGVRIISSFAFSCSRCLTSIVLPPSVREIGRSAFSACRALRRVKIPASAAKLGQELFDGCGNLLMEAPAGSAAARYAERYKIPFSESQD